MKVCIITLGCKVNQYESAELANKLRASGNEVAEKYETADVYIINTCAVTQFAEKKSRYEVSRIIRHNPAARIIVCGCASQFNSEQFKCSQVVEIHGTDKSEVLTLLFKEEGIARRDNPKRITSNVSNAGLPRNDNSPHVKNRVHIKVQDGCNNFCSYCIVPHLRGRSKSRPIKEILAEIAALPTEIKEVTLTGIDLSSYGLDIGITLADLGVAIDRLNRPFRLSSIEAGIVSEQLLNTLSSCVNFLPHFHLPLQSGSDDVLAAMNRKYTTKQYIEKVNLIRKKFPNATLTTDVIVGFPTETSDNFDETLNLFKQIRFNSAHIFPYSRRTGTAAAALKPLQPSVVTERAKILTAAQSQITQELLQTFIGKTLHVLVESCKGEVYNATSAEYISVRINSAIPLPLDWQDVSIVSIENSSLIALPKH